MNFNGIFNFLLQSEQWFMEALINLEAVGDARRRCTRKETKKKLILLRFAAFCNRLNILLVHKNLWCKIQISSCYLQKLTFFCRKMSLLQQKAIRSHHGTVIAVLYLWNDNSPTMWSVIGVKHTENNSSGLIIFYG